MQFNYSHQLSKGRYQTWLLIFIKVSVLVFCSVYIWNKIHEYQITLNALGTTIKGIDKISLSGIIFIMALMPANWSLEALKWKYLIKPFARISILNSLKAVFSGLAFGFATPRSIGDYFGRVIFLDIKDRKKAIIPTIISRVSQLAPTLLVGTVGLIFLLPKVHQIWTIALWSFILFVGIVLGVIQISSKGKGLAFIDRLMGELLIHYQWNDQFRVLGMSFLRYFVFSLQFILALKIMNVNLPLFVLFAGVSWIFLAKSILPSFNFLSDLGIREFSAILFFEAYELPLEPIFMASILIWTINILFPAILGVLIIGKSKFDLWY